LGISAGRIACVVSPRHSQRADVTAIYLIECRISAIPGITAGGLPISGGNRCRSGLGGARDGCDKP
jgi:hypothetical protein